MVLVGRAHNSTYKPRKTRRGDVVKLLERFITVPDAGRHLAVLRRRQERGVELIQKPLHSKPPPN